MCRGSAGGPTLCACFLFRDGALYGVSQLVSVRPLDGEGVVARGLREGRYRATRGVLVCLQCVRDRIRLVLGLMFTVYDRPRRMESTTLTLWRVTCDLLVGSTLDRCAGSRHSLLSRASHTVFRLAYYVYFEVSVTSFLRLRATLRTGHVIGAATRGRCVVNVNVLDDGPLSAFFVFRSLLRLLQGNLRLEGVMAVLLIYSLSSSFYGLGDRTMRDRGLYTMYLDHDGESLQADGYMRRLVYFANGATTGRVSSHRHNSALFLYGPRYYRYVYYFAELTSGSRRNFLVG